MREGIRVREITNDEGKRLLGSCGARRARWCDGEGPRWCCSSAQGMDVAQIAKMAFTSPDRVREVIHNFNDDGFDSLGPEVLGRPTTEVHPARAPGDQEDRPVAVRSTTTCPFRPGACPSWPSSSSPRGWSTTSATRACACSSERRASRFK